MYEWDFYDNLPNYHPIADANNLSDGFYAARKGSHWKAQIQRFRWNEMSEIRKLQIELDNLEKNREGAYKLSEYSRFEVNERGKTRAITALQGRDRTVKHVLNDRYLVPHIRPHLIYDNGASLKGKGIDFTRGRLIAHLERYYKEHKSNQGYIMLMDFSGYYDNMDHGTAMQMIRKYEPDPFARKLVKQAYDSYRIDVSYMSDEEYRSIQNKKFSVVEYRKANCPKSGKRYLNRSMSVGDQTSQITAIAYATPIDKLVTIVNAQHYYARYMDDSYIIAETKEELLELRSQIEEMAKRLHLFLNPKKVHICRLDHTFTFLKFKYYLTAQGHVVVRINPKTVTRMRRKLKRLAVRVRDGKTRQEKVDEMFRSWIANYKKYMSKKQITNMVNLYRALFGGGLDQWMKAHSIM